MVKCRTHRRSGNAVHGIATQLGWKPEMIVQVGVGVVSKEIEVFHEEWPDVPMIGFEPNPESFKNLAATYPGKLVNTAIGREDRCSVPFYVKRGHDGGSSLLQVGEDKSKLKKISVMMIGLDSFFSLHGMPVNSILLWLDCEGTELGTLQGAPLLLRRVGMINIEMTGRPSADGWCSPEDVHALLTTAGFYQTWVHTVKAKIGQYDAIYVRGSLFRPEFCCCPGEVARWRKEMK